MTKRKLDLSHTLAPLNHELQDMLRELLALKEQDSPLFSEAIDEFIHKYGSSPYSSLEELLESSAAQSAFQNSTPTGSLDDLLKDLL